MKEQKDNMSDDLKIPFCNNIEELVQLLIESVNNISSSTSNNRIFRIEVEIPDIDPIDWLYNQKSSKKIYWSDRDYNFEISAIGTADFVRESNYDNREENLINLSKHIQFNESKLRYFGGFRFNSNKPISDDWKSYGDFLFILPQFELIRRNDKCLFGFNFKINDSNSIEDLIEKLKSLSFSLFDTPEYYNELLTRMDNPDKSGWQRKTEEAKDKISSGNFDKIVLSRQTELVFDKNINPEILLKKLKSESNNCYLFLLQINESCSFLGATPEKLFTRRGNKIECEAIAGTVKRSDKIETDNRLGQQLLSSKKDIKEHRFVIKSIKESISDVVENHIDSKNIKVELLKLKTIQHLVSRFNYELKENISDFEVLRRLNPTAAVGGYPKEKVLDVITEIENFDRGWYAAPIGWIGSESTEFVVGIRSGLVLNNRLLLYSGAGIIESSDVNSEWDEIENKISNFLNIIV